MDNQNEVLNTKDVHETASAYDPKISSNNKAVDVKSISEEITTPSDLKSSDNGDITPESETKTDCILSATTGGSVPNGDNEGSKPPSKPAKDIKSTETIDSKSNISEINETQGNEQHSNVNKDSKDQDEVVVKNKEEPPLLEVDDNKENEKAEDNDKDIDELTNREHKRKSKVNDNETSADKKDTPPSPKGPVESKSNANEDSTKEELNNGTEADKQAEHDDEPQANLHEEIEGEFEDVEIPEEVDELIVPDEGDDVISSPSADEDKAFNDVDTTKDSEAEEETNPTKNQEDDETNDTPIESELEAIEESLKGANECEEDQTANAVGDVSNNTADDPLNCLDTQRQEGDESNNSDIGQQETGNKSEVENPEEEDDDVQFVETRNSPICIESDEEDSRDTTESADQRTISLLTSTITVPKNLIVTRTSARKSTARPQSAAPSPQSVSQQQKKPKNFSYLDKATTYRRSLPASLTITTQNVVDTIEVLDSSDEDSTPHNRSMPQKLRTPPKRTLLAAKGVHANKTPNKASLARRGIPNNFATHIRQQAKKPAPPPLPPPTPQSNFLNNVQLQPAAAGSNPPAFSALLSNKSVIIPNAFYGNPPSVRGHPADIETERRYVRWLENFVTQFCNPQLVASHSCFVFLQRALKYKDFVRIKNIRTNLNVHARTATEHLNHQLMLDLRAIFLKSSKEVTAHGRRFCEMACSTPQNKTVTLLIHASTGKTIVKSCNMEVPSTTSPSPSTSSSNTNSTSTTARKRRIDEDEYVPVKIKLKSTGPVENGEDVNDESEGRNKRSLRSKRAKRLDNSFSYNEDDLAEYDIDDEEEAERAARAEIQRKIDEKRLEAQRQRQQQAKSFESAFIQAFAKSIDGRSPKTSPPVGNRSAIQRARLNNSLASASVQQHLANNDAEDLLQATWIENVENEEAQIISDDEEPKQHRIYKQMEKKQLQLQRSTQKEFSRNNIRKDNHQQQLQHVADACHWPKNTDVNLHCVAKNKDVCVVCNIIVQRIVHHYVNEHRGCETYTSRLTTSQVEHLRRGSCNILNVTLYKNGQPQYEAHCIFCQKQSRFMLPYWIQHFTMHTGEYAYRCSGCGIRKPTRSLLTQHHSQGCTGNGSVLQDYTHDTKTIRVDARICTLCNFVQLHRSNIVKHLHQQHGVKQILPKHIQTIVLLKMDASTDSSAAWPTKQPETTPTRRQPQTFTSPSSSTAGNTYVIEDDDDDTLLFGDTIQPPTPEQRQVDTNAQHYSYNYIPPYMMNSNNNITWEENTPGDDLSYMICGMLDVQMNSE